MFEHEQDFSFNFKRLFVPLTKKKAILIIATLGSIIFLISLFNGFVWDDIVFILNNPQVHPINVESVAYIGAGTPSELYFLPGISAFLLAHRKNVPGKKFMLIIGLLLVSVLAKETGFLFLFLIVIYRHLFKLN